MPLSAHALGSVNLLDETKYICVHEGDQGWDPNFALTVVGLRASDGARLGASRIGETRRSFQVVCLGANYLTSRANADAIDAVLIQARNFPRTGTLISYLETDSSESVGDSWKVLAGLFKRLNTLRPSGLIEGVLTLSLSKA